MVGVCLEKYDIKCAPFDSDYCHCRICQRQTGAPVYAWIDFKKEQIKFLDGKVKKLNTQKTFGGDFTQIVDQLLVSEILFILITLL